MGLMAGAATALSGSAQAQAESQAEAGALSQPAPAHWSALLHAYMNRVAQIDWRLATLDPARCPRVDAGFGISFDSLSAYAAQERAAVAAALRMGDLPQVAAVAAGSPAAAAGVVAGDRLRAIDGQSASEIVQAQSGTSVADRLETFLAAQAPNARVRLELENGGIVRTAEIVPVPRCNIRNVVVVEDKVDAWSDAHATALTTGLVGFVANEDELALIAGHEMAHAMLGDKFARDKVRNKRKEDAADRLGAELAACAGYDVGLASRFWLRYDQTRALAFLPTFTHRASKVRYRNLAALAPQIDCAALGLARN